MCVHVISVCICVYVCFMCVCMPNIYVKMFSEKAEVAMFLL